MRVKKTYISRNYKGVNSAGGKARTDTEAVLDSIGYQNIGLKQSAKDSKIQDFFLNFAGILKALLIMPIGGIVFLQYPVKKYYSLICWTAHLKGCRVISLVHDLGAFRRAKLTVSKELGRLNKSDAIITCNPEVTKWLGENGSKSYLTEMNIWHYLSDDRKPANEPDKPSYNPVIVYAGALNRRKNSFLYDYISLSRNHLIDLYGGGFDSEPVRDASNYEYKGYMNSDDFIQNIVGDFGLVWDGDSVDGCSGSFGSYLKYNTPHKISLYIRSLLPIIIWKEAAMAPFLKEKGVAVIVDSLTEIDAALASLSEVDRIVMRENVIKLSNEIGSGYYLKEAVGKAESHLL